MIIDVKQHHGQLTIGDLEKAIFELKHIYGDMAKAIPVYIGRDSELNGIHMAFCVDQIPEYQYCASDQVYYRKLIKEDCSNQELWSNEAALLIS